MPPNPDTSSSSEPCLVLAERIVTDIMTPGGSPGGEKPVAYLQLSDDTPGRYLGGWARGPLIRRVADHILAGRRDTIDLTTEIVTTAIRLADQFARAEIESLCTQAGPREWDLDSADPDLWRADVEADAFYLVMRDRATRRGNLITFPMHSDQ